MPKYLELAHYQSSAKLFNDRVLDYDTQVPGYAKKWQNLTTQLLAVDGDLVVPYGADPDIDALTTSLVFWNGTKIRSRKGRPINCHGNSARLYESGVASAIGTGYALSNDGLWRQHSWGLTADDLPIETTTRRLVYAGIRLTDALADAFVQANRN